MSKERYIQFSSCVSDILSNNKISEMKNFKQHGSTNTYMHCLYVAYISYIISKKIRANPVETARGAMLHDFFLYDWHVTKHEQPHAFGHAKVALDNSEKYFDLTDREKDIILKHMWPVTPKLPRYTSSYIVTIADKYCATMEFFRLNRRFLRIANVRES